MKSGKKAQAITGLNDVLPKAELLNRFGSVLTREEYGKTALRAIAAKNPGSLHHVAASVWNRIVQKQWFQVDPQFAPLFRTADPNLYRAISELIGTEVIRDIYWVRGWASKKKERSKLVVDLMVAWVFRSDLFLADVTFRDPSRPLPEEERKFLQTHKGLGLLPALMTNMQRKAEELGCEQLTLVAATVELANIFERFGFVVEDSEIGRRGMRWGVGGIPMERDV